MYGGLQINTNIGKDYANKYKQMRISIINSILKVGIKINMLLKMLNQRVQKIILCNIPQNTQQC